MFISIDVETSGPIPGEFSLLSIGACHVDDDTVTFSCQLNQSIRMPIRRPWRLAGFLSKNSLAQVDRLKTRWRNLRHGFEKIDGDDATPVFVGFNAPFDWSFINYYFLKFMGANPFGFSALDIKAYYMGATGSSWRETRSSAIEFVLKPQHRADHDALHDAQYQAELFRLMRKRISSRQ